MSKRLITIKVGGAAYPSSSDWVTTRQMITVTDWPIEETEIHFGTSGTDFVWKTDMELKFIGVAQTPQSRSITFSARINGQLKYWKGPISSSGISVVDYQDLVGDGSMQAYLVDIYSMLLDSNYGLDALKVKINNTQTTLGQVQTTVGSVKTQTDKLNDATIGLSAIKTAVNTAITNIATVDTVVDSIKALAENSSYGLSAIKSKLDTVGTGVTSLSSALAVTDGVADAIKALLENATYGLSALKDVTAGTRTDLSLAKTTIDNAYSSLTDATYGLAALKVMLDEMNTSEDSEMLGAILNRLARIHFVLVGTNF